MFGLKGQPRAGSPSKYPSQIQDLSVVPGRETKVSSDEQLEGVMNCNWRTVHWSISFEMPLSTGISDKLRTFLNVLYLVPVDAAEHDVWHLRVVKRPKAKRGFTLCLSGGRLDSILRIRSILFVVAWGCLTNAFGVIRTPRWIAQ
jgi:hypothetical protein